jgi:hypothetical protein
VSRQSGLMAILDATPSRCSSLLTHTTAHFSCYGCATDGSLVGLIPYVPVRASSALSHVVESIVLINSSGCRTLHFPGGHLHDPK